MFISATAPAKVMGEIQQFVGVKDYFTEDNFVFNEEQQMFCFKDDTIQSLDDACFTAGSKGRTTNKHLDAVVNEKLHAFFRPFDEYLAKQTNHEFFDWNYRK